MARMSISVPDELKARMDAVDGVNWSALAQQVWERAACKPMEGGKMNDMVSRLKAQKAEYEESETTTGHKEGRDWATQFADYEDLVRLEKVAAQHNDHLQDRHDTSLQDLLYNEFNPRNEDTLETMFTDDEGKPNITDRSEENLEGFVEGALEAFGEVKGQL
jgi:hypothetical protein